jgi:hypothetical protein
MERPGMSFEDGELLKIMENNFVKEKDFGQPHCHFVKTRPRLPNNRVQAIKRTKGLDCHMQKDPMKKEHLFTFMNDMLKTEHAELAPPPEDGKKTWYLPIFGVYHPQKPNRIRGVVDSEAKHCGVSLNDVLMSGPDVTNNFIRVLIPVVIMTAAKQVF